MVVCQWVQFNQLENSVACDGKNIHQDQYQTENIYECRNGVDERIENGIQSLGFFQ
jgi:hypothetical protein